MKPLIRFKHVFFLLNIMKCLEVLCSEFIIKRNISLNDLSESSKNLIKELWYFNDNSFITNLLLRNDLEYPKEYYKKNYENKYYDEQRKIIVKPEDDHLNTIQSTQSFQSAQSVHEFAINYNFLRIYLGLGVLTYS